jgi:alpha-tubulin suppressor-like RCC1 family protein
MRNTSISATSTRVNAGVPSARTSIRSFFAIPHRLAALVFFAAMPLLAGCDAYSWGNDDDGQLGDHVFGTSLKSPDNTTPGRRWLNIDAEYDSSCGVLDNSTLWCWGAYGLGSIDSQGFHVFQDTPKPQMISGDTDWKQVSTGFSHKCAIKGDGELWCWGVGYWGQLGNGLFTDSITPVRVGTASDWQQVSAGNDFSCGIRNQGELYCWGNNDAGQLGLGDTNYRAVPTQVSGGPWQSVDTGGRHTCAIDVVKNHVYCWGRNTEDQVTASSSTSNFLSPVLFESTNIAGSQVSTGAEATCVRLIDTSSAAELHNAVYCSKGATPDMSGSTAGPYVGCTASQCVLKNLPKFSDIDVGSGHACGIVEDSGNSAVCWGAGKEGQLGHGFATNEVLPVAIAGGRAWWSVRAGASHTVALEYPDL